jgi:hypothetical protein
MRIRNLLKKLVKSKKKNIKGVREIIRPSTDIKSRPSLCGVVLVDNGETCTDAPCTGLA